MANDILLEAGTNEMELLVFKLDRTSFGINVAKVREIIQRPETITIPHAPYGVEGSFKLRERVLTLVNLAGYFDMEGQEVKDGNGMIIVVEFNDITCGVLVDKVEAIHRLSWDEIKPPSQYLTNLSVPITGTATVNDVTVLVADFESIISQILGLEITKSLKHESELSPELQNARILLADDSTVLRTSLVRILSQAGFNDLTICSDGQEAWDKIEAGREKPNGPFDLIMSDIEMPQMDGLNLTLKIKGDPQLKAIPVILFSSLISDDNLKKGESVGADAQVSKPDSEGMIKAIKTCLIKRLAEITA